MQNICHKASNKTKALEQAQVLVATYILSKFRYCPLIWMFYGKMSENRIVKTLYRTLRAIYDTQAQSHEELLDLSRRKKIHGQNLMVEVYKCLNNISPPFIWDYFKQKNDLYSLRNTQLLELRKYRSKTYGLNTALFKGAITALFICREKLPNHFKEAKSLTYFKNKIREWTERSCTCFIYP